MKSSSGSVKSAQRRVSFVADMSEDRRTSIDINSNNFSEKDEAYDNPSFQSEPIQLNSLRRVSETSSYTVPFAAALKTHNVQKSYGNFSVLKGINMTVPQGSIYGLLGASGCGKTTFLRCVVGRHKPDSGSIKVFGFTPGKFSRNSVIVCV